jgi:hypothetical protein
LKKINAGLGLLAVGALLTLFALESVVRGFAGLHDESDAVTGKHCSRLNDHERRLRWLEIGGGKCAEVPSGGGVGTAGSGEGVRRG